jgi:hypothetical protein
MLEEWGVEVHLTTSIAIEMVISRIHAPTSLSATTARRMTIEPCHAHPKRD